jgi:hypothetical protein
MSESTATCWEAVEHMDEHEYQVFGVTDSGELDLGLPAANNPPLPPDLDVGEAWTDLDFERAGWTPADPAQDQEDYAVPDAGEPPGDWPEPDDDEALFVAGMPPRVREDYLAGPWTGAGEKIEAGFLHHLAGPPTGAGFASGGTLDGLEPGDWLARALTTATADGHDQLGESELIGVLCAWRRMASWAAAGEAAAVLALARRRAAACAGEPVSSRQAEHVVDEIAAALTLTGRSADRLLAIAAGLGRLPDVHASLERGEIDWPKACVFADELAVLDDTLAQGIALRLLGRAGAGGWTTGQLRAALRRAVLAADPGAAERRRQDARQDAAVQAFGEASGNAGLAGRELPPAEVLAADRRLTALARWLQRRGAGGTISGLRAIVYTALLNGRPMENLLATLIGETAGDKAAGADVGGARDPAAASCDARHDGGPGDDASAGDNSAAHRGADHGTSRDAARDRIGAEADAAARSWPAVTGTIHLTMPVSAFAGGGLPGEVAGHGPIDAALSRDLAAMLAASAATRWCLTVTGPDGRAVGHACARRGPEHGQPVIQWAAGLRDKLKLLEAGICGHRRQAAGYAPPGSLAHLIKVRQRTCAAPGCRRPASRCDLDHTVPYHRRGITCECNLAPLCRRHHRAKQAPGWHLWQPEPGRMTWRLPSGRVYETTGDPY